MILFAIPNLSSSQVSAFDVTEPPAMTRPAFAGKEDYRKWCSNEHTDHAFVSLAEGISPHLRVSAGNPAYRLHGLVGEYDATVPADWETAYLAKMANPPEWSTRTFSGNGRVYWSFAESVDVSIPAFATEFIRIAQQELRMKRAGPGFEAEESGRLAQYFEVGTHWTKIGGPIPSATLEAWRFKAAQKLDWSREAVAIPITRVRAEAERRFPGRWPNGWASFDVGVRGVRFWDGSADATSVLVTESGCVCFTGEKAWVPWADIFGHEWVKRQSDDVIGNALRNLWCEPAAGRYWRKESDGRKVQIPTRTDLILHLNVAGLSPKVPKGDTLSEIDRAIHTLQRLKVVAGTHPAFYRTSDTVEIGGLVYLNTSTVRPGASAEGVFGWGEKFGWIAGYLDRLLGREQRIRFIAWLAHAYQAALLGLPCRGLACFLGGEPGVGKTFLGAALLRYILGAREDAGAYLTGDDAFNKTLFASPFWCVDDQVISSDRKHRLKYSQLIKYVTANDSIKMRGMYQEGYTAPWCGRVLVTFNLDGESMGMLPDLEIASLDKTLIFKTSPIGDLRFPSDAELALELPYFCAYLRDFVIPEAMREPRFGVKKWHHPDLLTAAAEASDTMGAEQILHIWRKRHFEENAGKKEWVGSATELLTEIERYEDLKGVLSRQIPTPNRMGHYVGKLEARHGAWITRGPAGRSGYRPIRILKPTEDDGVQ